MRLTCQWDNINLHMDFYLHEKKGETSVKALCFTSIMRIKSFNGNAKLTEQEAYFHHIEPQNPLTISPSQPWHFSVKEFGAYEGYIFHPLRLSDGPKAAYVIVENKRGALEFIDIEVDFTFTEAKQKVKYNASSLALKLPPALPHMLEDSQNHNLSITPQPYEIIWGKAKMPPLFTIEPNSPFINAFEAAKNMVSDLWGKKAAKNIQYAKGQANLQLLQDKNLTSEAYKIQKQGQNGYVIKASSYGGFFYGFVSLYQHFMYSQDDQDIEHLTDKPRFSLRGCHLDVARRFYTIKEIKAFLREMAWYKLNLFHLHFSDDEAWRIEIKAFPELTTIGAFCGHHEKIRPIHCASWRKSGGFYTQEEIKELISYAKSLNIDILPEFDMPGHSYAILQSLPHLREPQKTKPIHTAQGFFDNLLNPALPQTYEFLEIVLKELSALFPYPYFHLGGDEVPMHAWMDSEICRKLAMQEGFDFTTENLQSYIMGRAQDILQKNGKKSCGWEEASYGIAHQNMGFKPQKNAYLILWSDLQKAKDILAKGYNLVISPGSHYYLDMAQGDDISDNGLSWAGSSSAQKTYLLEPLLDEFKDYKNQIWGVQACIWGSDYPHKQAFDHMVYPRLIAVAETAWSMPKNKNWPHFKQRLKNI